MNAYSLDLGQRVKITEARIPNAEIRELGGKLATVIEYGGRMTNGRPTRPRILQPTYRILVDGEQKVRIIEEEYLEVMSV